MFSGSINCVEIGAFRKSSYSGDKRNCVEVGAFGKSSFSDAKCVEVGVFKKSTFSSNGDCVEVGGVDDVIVVRDSKNPNGGTQSYTFDEWQAFINGVKAGEFDLPS